jgi:flavin-dependent dehydrogenase
MSRRGSHAIVIGASMGGLLAARALANHFQSVMVLERDAFRRAATRTACWRAGAT